MVQYHCGRLPRVHSHGSRLRVCLLVLFGVPVRVYHHMLYALTAPCIDAVNLSVGCLNYRRIRILAYGRLLECYPVLPVNTVVRFHHRQRSARSLAVLYALGYWAVVADKHMRAVF